MSSSFLGGIWKRGSTERRPAAPTPEAVNEDWGWVGEKTELFLRGDPTTSRLFRWDGLAILLRGYARPAGSTTPLDLERLAEELRCHYLEHGTLAVDDLDGCFSVALLDSQAERLLLYRNLVGTGFLYYHPTPDGLLFGGNLAELLELAMARPRANATALPAFFLFRCVPGRETLFSDFYRLLPGEQVSWDRRGLTRQQRHTFASLRCTVVGEEEALEQVDAVMAAVLADCVAHRPGAVNLLSGGVDSSYIQAILKRTAAEELPASYSVSIDHRMTWLDNEYAITASQVLGTRHKFVPADGTYSGYLSDAVETTAEPLNHVQSAYFGHLARAMRDDGVSAALCGEGADSLFGLVMANQIHNAGVIRRLLPLSRMRRLVGAVSGALGWSRLAATCRLADQVGNFAYPEHPINRVACFTDWAAVEGCFGESAVTAAAAERRRLLDLYRVPYRAQDRLHAAGFLGEAVDSAGLWATLFGRAGVDLLCPFLDSRMVRLALNLAPEVRYRYRRPKDLLKRALARHAGEEMAMRAKLGFGQPIFEWLAPGGPLAPLAGQIDPHPFIEPETLCRTRREPTWFLYSLLVYDVWHKLFIQQAAGGSRRSASGERAIPDASVKGR
jgi:asparagine synthase (glutamine-hydrolysing)